MVWVKFDSPHVPWYFGGYYESIEDAERDAELNGYRIVAIGSGSAPIVRDGSGFQPHFNIGLGKYIETKGQYNRELKSKGLIEVGNEPVGKQTKPQRKSFYSDEMIRTANQMGASFTDSDVKQLRAKDNGK